MDTDKKKAFYADLVVGSFGIGWSKRTRISYGGCAACPVTASEWAIR
jgi:hypothetical protein